MPVITKFRNVQIDPGNLWVGDGDPDTTMAGGDVHIEGTLEVDGALNLDGAIAFGNTLTVGESGTGYDVIFYGDTADNYFHWDADTDSLLQIGASAKYRLGTFAASTAGSGSALSATNSAAFRVYADDGGAAIGSGTLARAGVFRNLLTYTGGNREQEAAGVVGQVVSVAGTNRHNMAGTWGSYEARTSLVVDGQAFTTDTWIQAGVLGRVGGASITINTNGVLAGVAAMSNVATALATNNGIFPAFYAGKWASTETWSHGLYIQAGAVDQGINVGASADAVASGVDISETNTAANRFYADDAGDVIATAAGSVPDVKNLLVRTLITKDNSSYDGRVHSIMGQLKSVDGEWGDEQWSAVHGYLELVQDTGSITLQSYGVTAGVMATVETQGTFGVAVTHNLRDLLQSPSWATQARSPTTPIRRVCTSACTTPRTGPTRHRATSGITAFMSLRTVQTRASRSASCPASHSSA